MAEIYTNSYFTIVAAQGDDADAGLRGISQITPPRHFKNTNALKYENHYEAISIQAMRLMRSKWYSRGWTFQEQIFSRRKLIFHNDTVNWECHCAAWYENQKFPNNYVYTPCNRSLSSTQFAFGTNSWPDFYRYARLVSLYNQRSLTFPEDVLNAFAGVTATLGSSFDGGFICGLPQMFFDAALLWQPYSPVKRRKAIRSKETLPSWSWIGWQGDLHSESWRSGYNYIKDNPDEALTSLKDGRQTWEQTSWRTESTVHWSYSQTLESKRFPVVNSSQKYYAKDSLDDIQVPGGWTREVHNGKSYFRHATITDQHFWYPIPLPSSFTTKPPPFEPNFLHGRTRRCSLQLGSTFTNSKSSRCLSCHLVDTNGHWAGVLRLNIGALSDPIEDILGSECILIELSSGSVRNQLSEAVSFDEWDLPECLRESGLYEFYNVIWIGEDAGVAYRAALGRVMKSVWEKYAYEADVTLG